nr:hypothetical protein Clen_34 [Cedratvirus lena]
MVFWKRKIIYSFMISKLSSVQWSFGRENYLCPMVTKPTLGPKNIFGENSFRPFSKNSTCVKNPKGILSKKYFLDPGLVW